MARRILWPVFVFVLAMLPACSGGPPDDAVAVVGGHPVRLEAFQWFVERETGRPWTAADGAVACRLLDQFLDREVVLEAARARGLLHRTAGSGKDADVPELLAGLCGPPPTPSPEEVEAAVEREMATPRPERVEARQLVYRTRAEAERAIARLRAGEPWEKVSKDSSLAPNAKVGGGLGWLERGVLPSGIEQALFSARVGTVTGPVEGPGGFHVFEILERCDGGPPDRDAVRKKVLSALVSSLARRHQSACLERLRREAGLVVMRDRLWFGYDGRRTGGTDDDGKSG